MRLSFAELVAFVRPVPPMADGFGQCEYEFRLLSVDEALSCITCWDKRSTIVEYAQANAATDKVACFVQAFPSSPLVVVAFSLNTFAKLWPEEYGDRFGEQLVIWDGNNRLSALARRRKLGHDDQLAVGMFVGVQAAQDPLTARTP